ncbi:MAG: hypothetical protein DIZ80_03785 [endosymbiont of Galathealinum brachiosum]|uniref:Methyl-accepting transducer domain-containing protein n=1 Tax=endosymbiont of Galathealinum brachiosum TaxID=2200906 RepID=A0A370DI47_9GAMM|nr:MAG: hypothetical protein DIZ80_03785 [endosymbiont of Galathealinum brachiosum]
MAKIELQPPFVISALLAGRLYRMLEITKVMYISSSNAKCISIRGGDKTAGFKPITEFISDMARDTISISSKINAVALKFSITAVNEKRTNNALNNFTKAIEKLESESKAREISALIEKLHIKISELKKSQADDCKYLSALFDDISQGIRAAKVIVTNSRTEASRAGEYQTNLFAIANDLEGCSDDITSEIKICKTYLDDLTKMTGK